MFSMILAATVIAVNSVTQDPTTRAVSINYTVTGDPAVVTLGSVRTNGAEMAESNLTVVSGDVNRLVQPGPYALKWQPPKDCGFGPFDAGAVEIALKAWATNAPPDYMVINLAQPERGVRYYVSASAIPGGVTDERYKTDYLVMRRIPAAGVIWRMGSPTTESGRGGSDSEATHYVKLTEDYYLAVYPATIRQYYWLNGKNMPSDKYVYDGTTPLANYGAYDWNIAVSGMSYYGLRGTQHATACTLTGDALKEPYKVWPRNGHEISPVGTTCSVCGKISNPLLSSVRTNWPAFLFDLPTEAQWEFACRGGSEVYEVRPGEPADVGEIARYVVNSSNATASVVTAVPQPVGTRKPNGFGLYDMLGNVAEWTLDGFGAFTNAETTVFVDPAGVELPYKRDDNVSRRVLRGGSFYATAAQTRTAARVSINPFYSYVQTHTAAYSLISNQSAGIRLWLPCYAVK